MRLVNRQRRDHPRLACMIVSSKLFWEHQQITCCKTVSKSVQLAARIHLEKQTCPQVCNSVIQRTVLTKVLSMGSSLLDATRQKSSKKSSLSFSLASMVKMCASLHTGKPALVRHSRWRVLTRISSTMKLKTSLIHRVAFYHALPSFFSKNKNGYKSSLESISRLKYQRLKFIVTDWETCSVMILSRVGWILSLQQTLLIRKSSSRVKLGRKFAKYRSSSVWLRRHQKSVFSAKTAGMLTRLAHITSFRSE